MISPVSSGAQNKQAIITYKLITNSHYKLIYERLVTEPEVTTCFSINFQVNIIFWAVYFVLIYTLHCFLHHGINIKFGNDTSSFVKYKHVTI